MTKEKLNKLKQINKRLTELQEKILYEAVAIDKELIKRVQNKEDPLDDYEIEYKIDFVLKEDDPKYKQDEDNFLASIIGYVKGVSIDYPAYPYRAQDNHNEFQNWDHEMKDEKHCWWYHELYDHKGLDFEDILRIGLIWSDIDVTYQYFRDRS